ncbi:acetylpolyamine aminohydrolase [Burkholderia pseudomallei]|nr:acetylpolyamine aminohydrolase [Burkholderia pseudomallei]
MLTYFHPDQLKHSPLTYLSRGKMRAPHEVPERAVRLLGAVTSLGFDVRAPEDFGAAPLAAVHSEPYLRFLADAHREWRRIPEDWGPEVMSNIYVREPNPLRGVLAQAGYYLADGSCPIGEHTYRAAYWSAQSALAGAAARRRSAAARAMRTRSAARPAIMRAATRRAASAI